MTWNAYDSQIESLEERIPDWYLAENRVQTHDPTLEPF